MTDEEKAAVEAEDTTEQKPAEPAAPADDVLGSFDGTFSL